MKYTSEINFLKKLLSQFYLNTNLITNEQPLDERIDNGLRKFLGIEEDYKKSFHAFLLRAQSNIIYKISDLISFIVPIISKIRIIFALNN